MDENEQLSELADAVRALFVARRGAFNADEFIAVARLLGFEAWPQSSVPDTPLPLASNYFADLVGTNLAHALAAYAWGDWRPLTDDGVTIAGFWDGAENEAGPAGYVLGGNGRYWQHKQLAQR